VSANRYQKLLAQGDDLAKRSMTAALRLLFRCTLAPRWQNGTCELGREDLADPQPTTSCLLHLKGAMPMTEDQDRTLQGLLDRLAAGDAKAVEDLVEHSLTRFRRMASRMLKDSPVVRRWEETDDVLQAVAVRLWRALQDVKPDSVRAFVGLAATQIRRELIDLARHHRGAQADAAHHQSDPQVADSEGHVRPRYAEVPDPASGPTSQLQAQELHEHVHKLPDAEREVYQLLFYQDMTQEQVAQVLGVSASTVKRRYEKAQHLLHRAIHGKPPRR
jgi:RNA polymerase sigma-70 factor (ECF subfamily)